jgi:hypothetical protein
VSLWLTVLRFGDFAAADAGGADAHALALAGDLGVYRLQVDVPAPLGDVVGVADAVSRLRLLAADITLLCHDDSPGIQIKNSDLLGQTLILQEVGWIRQWVARRLVLWISMFIHHRLERNAFVILRTLLNIRSVGAAPRDWPRSYTAAGP